GDGVATPFDGVRGPVGGPGTLASTIPGSGMSHTELQPIDEKNVQQLGDVGRAGGGSRTGGPGSVRRGEDKSDYRDFFKLCEKSQHKQRMAEYMEHLGDNEDALEDVMQASQKSVALTAPRPRPSAIPGFGGASSTSSVAGKTASVAGKKVPPVPEAPEVG
ncbi:unnamed protein product, partial [Amoebophrya sp. A25]